MKGRIYENKGGYIVRFGREISKWFKDLEKAERFLTGLRFKTDEGTFDLRDYQSDNPLSFANQSKLWLNQKKKSGIKEKTYRQYKRWMNQAGQGWADRNVKTITSADIEDFLWSREGLSNKSRHNTKSCFHDFFVWVCRREPKVVMPEFPEIKFELGWRVRMDIATQIELIEEVRRITKHNPKIWLAIKLLATYIKIRPGEIVSVREVDINLKSGYIHIPHPKDKQTEGKYAYLDEDDTALIRSFQRGLPHMYFFRHPNNRRAERNQKFGKRILYNYWRKACENLEIEGVSIYPGTKHTTATALGQHLTPEQIKRGGTGHATNKAFERYLQPHRQEGEIVTRKIKEMRGEVVKLPTTYLQREK